MSTGPTESGILFSKKQVIDASESSYYPAGTHHFMFEFPIDPQTPPYDNVSQGRIVQRVHARAPGVGAFGSDATASLRLVFAVVPSPLGELPPPLEWRHQAYSHDLGVRAHARVLSLGIFMLTLAILWSTAIFSRHHLQLPHRIGIAQLSSKSSRSAATNLCERSVC